MESRGDLALDQDHRQGDDQRQGEPDVVQTEDRPAFHWALYCPSRPDIDGIRSGPAIITNRYGLPFALLCRSRAPWDMGCIGSRSTEVAICHHVNGFVLPCRAQCCRRNNRARYWELRVLADRIADLCNCCRCHSYQIAVRETAAVPCFSWICEASQREFPVQSSASIFVDDGRRIRFGTRQSREVPCRGHFRGLGIAVSVGHRGHHYSRIHRRRVGGDLGGNGDRSAIASATCRSADLVCAWLGPPALFGASGLATVLVLVSSDRPSSHDHCRLPSRRSLVRLAISPWRT